MKKLILISMLLTLPVWAAETPVGANTKLQDTPVGAYIELRGAPKKVERVLNQIAKDDAYQSAECKTLPSSKNGKIVGISCKKPDAALMQMLKLGVGSGVKMMMSAQGCPLGCTNMACPPVSFPVACCKRTAVGYQHC